MLPQREVAGRVLESNPQTNEGRAGRNQIKQYKCDGCGWIWELCKGVVIGDNAGIVDL